MSSAQSSTSKRYRWFLLVDSEGKPYKNTSADFVDLDPGSIVAEFREKVMAKNTNKLANIDASDLKVYANEEDKEDKNEVYFRQLLQGSPLKSSDLLDAKGKTEDKALLVLVPDSVNSGLVPVQPSFTQSATDAFNSFQAKASLLESDPAVKELLQAVEDSYSEASSLEFLYFLFVSGSSGMGKTQLAMCLYHLWLNNRINRKICYIPLHSGNQAIYSYFEYLRQTFLSCIERDLALIDTNTTKAHIIGRDLFVFGFIDFIVQRWEHNSQFPDRIVPTNGMKLRDRNCKIVPEQRPVVILDEFSMSGRYLNNANALRFVRNAFLCVGIVPITMGTQAKVANLLESNEASRGDPPYDKWCHIITKLPALNVDCLPYKPQENSILDHLVRNSRPLFATKASRFVLEKQREYSALITDRGSETTVGPEEVYQLNDLLDFLFVDIVQSKFYSDEFHSGQIGLLLNACYGSESVKTEDLKNIAPWIDKHFGKLVRCPQILYLMTSGCLKDSLEIWKPICGFPTPDEDILLHLTLAGTRNHRAFFIGNTPVPFQAFLKEGLDKEDIRSRGVLNAASFRNAFQTGDDGNSLEVILDAAVTSASHQDGIGGISFNLFIRNVAYELCSKKISLNDLEILGEELIAPFKDIKFPYLLPANTEKPAWLKIFPRIVTHRRSVNSEKRDGAIDAPVCLSGYESIREGFGSLEAKNRKGKDGDAKLDIDTMKKILSVPKSKKYVHDKFFLVLTTKMQNSYFNGESWEEFRNTRMLEDTLVLKLTLSGKQNRPKFVASFSEIKGMPNSDSGKKGKIGKLDDTSSKVQKVDSVSTSETKLRPRRNISMDIKKSSENEEEEVEAVQKQWKRLTVFIECEDVVTL